MNKEFAKGLFVGGIIALIVSGIMMAFNLAGLAPLMWILFLDAWFMIDLMIDKLNEKNKKRRRK
jgi:hypothetical protein